MTLKAVRSILALVLLIGLVLAVRPSVSLAQPPKPPIAAVEDDRPATSALPAIAPESVAPERAAAILTVDGSCTDTTPPDLICDGLTSTYKTIQKAIDSATAGDTINVLAGTYSENVIVTKSLTLTGAGAATTTVYPAVSNPNPCTGSSLCGGATSASNVIVVAASDVVISGFTLDGDNPSLTSGIVRNGADLDARNGIITDHSLSLVFNGLEVYDTTVKNIYLRGLYASSGGTFTFHNNIVTNVQGDGYSIAIFAWYGPGTIANNTVSYANDAISANHSKGIQFLNNTVSHSGSGIHTDNAGDSGGVADLIQDNTVSDCATDGYGIWTFVPYLAPTVNRNTVTGCAVGLSAWAQGAAVSPSFTNNTVIGPSHAAGSVGVYITTDLISWGYSDISVSFQGNFITSNETGIYFTADEQSWNPEPYEAKTINAVFVSNGIEDNTYGADKGTNGTYNLDASSNWWGSNVAATVKSIVNGGDGIDYTPWFDSGTDTSVDSGFQGDYSTLWVDDDSLQTGSTGRIQEGINLVSGSTVNVAAGTYVENVVVNKSVTMRGPNYGISPNGGSRVAEAVVVPATSAIASGEIFSISASDVSIEGFTIDGDNTALTSGYLGTNGADIDAAEGVTVYYDNVNNLTVSHNIIRNLSYFGVTLFGASYSAPATTGHLVQDNLIQDLGTYDSDSGVAKWGGGVLLYNNQYTRVADNVMENVRIGVQTGNFSRANPGSATYQVMDGNTIEARRRGIFHNLHYGPTSPYTLSNNDITAVADANEPVWDGILLASLSVASTASGNTIDGSAVTVPSEGYEVWNVKSTSPSAISGGSVSGVSIGLFLNNYEGYSSDAGDGAHASVSGLSIAPNTGGTGMRVLDSPSSTAHANVQLAIGSGVSVSGGAAGLVVENANASVTSAGDLALSGQTGNYIGLVSNIGDIDATSVSFDGLTGATATLAQNFAIEDKVVHKVDDSSLGLVRVKAGEIFVTTSSGSIQRGIDAATAGDIVNVAAGTYTESPTIGKALRLLGAQADVAVAGRTAGAASEAAIQGKITVSASNVEVNGFTLTNPNQTNVLLVPASSPSYSDITLVYNLIDAVGGPSYTGGTVHAFLINKGPDDVTIAHNGFNNLKASGKSATAIGILDSASTDSSTGLVIEGNTISDVGSDTKGAYGVIINNKAGAPGAQIKDNTFSALSGGWTHAIGLEGPTPNASVTGNTCSSLTATGTDNACVFFEDNPDGGTVLVNQNLFNGSGFYGVALHPDDLPGGANGYDYTVNAENNWWGSPCGPSASAANVTSNVDYDPWWTDTSGGGTGAPGSLAIPAGATSAEQQAVLDCAASGSTITFAINAAPYAGGIVVNTNALTLNLGSNTFGPGSSWLIVNADDVTVLGPGVIDGDGDTNPAIVLNGGADNFTLKDTEVREWAHGVEVSGSVASLKIVGNWIHDNSGAGLKINSGVSIGGVVNIEGNLFKDNGGNGIQNDGATDPLKAEYNSWGHLSGPASGDGVSARVDAEPFTFIELFMDMDPDAEAIERRVVETTSFDVKLKADAAKLSGLTFKFTYDTAWLQLNSTMFAGVWGGTTCTSLSSTLGEVAYRCQLFAPSAEWDADGDTIATFNFTALAGPTGPGPWTTYFDIAHLQAGTSAGAVGGVKIYVNNAGYGAPSTTARDITDTDDGKIIIDGLANYTGYVDLQSRTNESGAVLKVYNQQAISGAVLLAQGTSAAGGSYTTAYETGKQLIIGTTYWLVIDRDLYLPTTAMGTTPTYPTIPTDWQHSKLLFMRPLTNLVTIVLLGGDATNDDVVDINDASCIGGDYGKTSGFTECGAPTTSRGTSDVNGDGMVDILDLSLMGGNFYLNSSPWVP